MRRPKQEASSGPREVRTLEPPSANRPSGMGPDYRPKRYREVKTALGLLLPAALVEADCLRLVAGCGVLMLGLAIVLCPLFLSFGSSI